MTGAQKSIFFRIIESRLSYLGALVLGILLGKYVPTAAEHLGELGDLFVNVLKMCILPIVITSVSLSIAHFILGKLRQGFVRIGLIMIVTLSTCAIVGAGTAYFFTPGHHIDPSQSEMIKALVDNTAQVQLGLNDPMEVKLTKGFVDLLFSAIPTNIFGAMASNSMLQVIVFSIIFGIALGTFAESSSYLYNLIRQTQELFTVIFDTIAYFFPIILLLLVARQTARVGTDIIPAMGGFILKFYAAVVILFMLSTLVIKVRSKATWYQSISIMRDPVIIALATQSSAAAIPPSITSMRRFNFEDNLVKLLIPLGSIVGRFGNILYFGFCTMFALQLYDIDLRISEQIMVVMMTIIAGIATAGLSGEMTLMSLSLVLAPVGIPITGILPLLQAVDNFINPMRTLAIVHTNCAALTLVAKPIGPILSLQEVQDLERNGKA